MPSRFGALVDRYAAIDAVGVGIHVRDREVVNADGITPIRGFATGRGSSEQEGCEQQ